MVKGAGLMYEAFKSEDEEKRSVFKIFAGNLLKIETTEYSEVEMER